MPAQFGIGPILNVTREIFQAFLMAAMSPRQMLSLLKRGEGETINLTLESKPASVRLPIFLEEEDFYIYIRRQLENLCACEYMLVRRKEACNKCPSTQPQSTNNDEANNIVAEKRKWSSQSQQNLTSTTEQQQSTIQSTNNSTVSSPTVAKQPRKSVPGNYLIFYIKFNMCIHIYTHTYIHMHICIYVYTYMYIQNETIKTPK